MRTLTVSEVTSTAGGFDLGGGFSGYFEGNSTVVVRSDSGDFFSLTLEESGLLVANFNGNELTGWMQNDDFGNFQSFYYDAANGDGGSVFFNWEYEFQSLDQYGQIN